MKFPAKRFKELSLSTKVIYSILIVACVVLGVIGLVLPIIPGLVFLFLAVLLATRVSRRAAAMAENHSGFNRHMRTWNTADKLSIGRRIKLGLLVGARMTIDGVEALSRSVGGLFRQK